MDLEYTADQQELRGAIREYLTDRFPTELIRELQREDNDGCPAGLWRELADQGWLGMAFSEDVGGGGASLFDLGVFYEESGRVLLPPAFYSTVHAGLLIAELGTAEQRDKLLRELVDGTAVSSVAFAEPGVHDDPAALRTVGRLDDSGWILHGSKIFVPNIRLADHLLVVARAGAELLVLRTPSAAPGVRITAQATIGKDKQGVVDLTDVALPGEAVLGTGDPSAAPRALDRVRDVVTALQAMEMVGGAQRVLDMTVGYVKERAQFGRPIGSFQAVQHHVADMAIAVHGARLVALQAMWLVSEGLPAKRALAMAKSAASETYTSVTLMAHQLHGGMGIVLEHDLYLWSQRAKSTALSFGTSDHHLERIASLLTAATPTA